MRSACKRSPHIVDKRPARTKSSASDRQRSVDNLKNGSLKKISIILSSQAETTLGGASACFVRQPGARVSQPILARPRSVVRPLLSTRRPPQRQRKHARLGAQPAAQPICPHLPARCTFLLCFQSCALHKCALFDQYLVVCSFSVPILSIYPCLSNVCRLGHRAGLACLSTQAAEPYSREAAIRPIKA